MARKAKKPKVELAPSYFVQYSALWCIMLGFFVMLLSLGSTQMGPGSDGLGEVRDAFGKTGGLGLLPFAKNALFGRGDRGASSFRIRESVPHKIGDEGYIRGMLWNKGLTSISMISVEESRNSTKIILRIPVEFEGYEHLERESAKLLSILSEVLINFRQHDFEVMVVCEDDPDPEVCQRHAMLRAAVVARFLSETSSLPTDHIQAVGYSDTRFINTRGIEHVNGQVLISIQQSKR